MTSNSIKK